MLRLFQNEFGDKEWTLNGELHREDGPAVEWANGAKEWYLNGKRHREDGPAIEYSNGHKSWFLNGLRHREDGPAVLMGSQKEWWINGEEIKKPKYRQITDEWEATDS